MGVSAAFWRENGLAKTTSGASCLTAGEKSASCTGAAVLLPGTEDCADLQKQARFKRRRTYAATSMLPRVADTDSTKVRALMVCDTKRIQMVEFALQWTGTYPLKHPASGIRPTHARKQLSLSIPITSVASTSSQLTQLLLLHAHDQRITAAVRCVAGYGLDFSPGVIFLAFTT